MTSFFTVRENVDVHFFSDGVINWKQIFNMFNFWEYIYLLRFLENKICAKMNVKRLET